MLLTLQKAHAPPPPYPKELANQFSGLVILARQGNFNDLMVLLVGFLRAFLLIGWFIFSLQLSFDG